MLDSLGAAIPECDSMDFSEHSLWYVVTAPIDSKWRCWSNYNNSTVTCGGALFSDSKAYLSWEEGRSWTTRLDKDMSLIACSVQVISDVNFLWQSDSIT